jgi:hypothetical protein
VVVDATRLNSVERTHALWEPTLTEVGYERTLFDGLNQWYVSPDHPELAAPLSYPACPIDPWTKVALGFPDPPRGDPGEVLSASALQLAVARTSQAAAEALTIDLQAECSKQKAESQALRARITELARAEARHRARIKAMEQSTSWRVTRPVRSLAGLARRRARPEA